MQTLEAKRDLLSNLADKASQISFKKIELANLSAGVLAFVKDNWTNDTNRKDFENATWDDIYEADFAGIRSIVISFYSKEEDDLLRETYIIDPIGSEVAGHILLARRANARVEIRWTETSEKPVNHTKKGLGTRRLVLANAYIRMQYDQPLHSNFMIKPEARQLWRDLYHAGMVKMFDSRDSDDYPRYGFPSV